MNSVIKQIGRESGRPVTVLTLLVGLVLALLISASLPNLTNAGAAAYPVRLCSPQFFTGGGQSQGTFNGNIGGNYVNVFSKAANGTVTYGKVGNSNGGWNAFDPAIRCGTPNTSNGDISDYGIRFFNSGNGLVYKNEEGGLEWTAPPNESFGQIAMKGRALFPPDNSSGQGGINGRGAFLKFDFLGGESKRWNPSTNWGVLDGFSADNVQGANKVRLGLMCDPINSASVCFGAIGDLALVSDLQITVLDNIAPTVTLQSSPIADGQWVTGNQSVTFTAQDQQSGLRETSVYLDNQEVSRKTINDCNLVIGTGANGGDTILQGKTFKPCTQEPVTDTISIDTTKFGDGSHTLRACARDFANWSTYWKGDEKGPESCTSPQDVFIDNSAPSAPETAEAINTRIPRSVNPNDVTWDNPGTGDQGSPIHEVIYDVVDQTGNTAVAGQTVTSDSPSTDPANFPTADNIIHITTLDTPDAPGEFTLRMRLEDSVGHVGKVAEVPLSYSCEDTGGTPLPQADIAMGLIEPKQNVELADSSLALDQGDPATVVGKVRGPGQMPVNGADLCINAKPIVDPQLQLLTEATTNGNGNYTSPLEPGPSRNLLTVFRQGHREVWSDPVRTDVTVEPTLSTGLKGGPTSYRKKQTKATVKSGTKVWFKGSIPGPYADKVVVVLQGKAAGTKAWRAFRRYRTRSSGKYKVPNRFFNTSTTGRKAHLVIRTQVRYTVGYPYSQGNSQVLKLTILPKKKK